MAVRTTATQHTSSASCRRCAEADSAIVVRNEPLCKSCFTRYVQSKVIKRMESFRVRNASQDKTRTLLLPLSLGSASMALLHVLSQYLKGQVERTGRTGFALHVLHIYTTETDSPVWDVIKARYPEHSYSIVSLSHAMDLHSVRALFPPSSDSQEAETSLAHLLASCTTATSRADMHSILRSRLVVAHAIEHDCECVVWGHCTTRLAEQVLAETAKGRGFALHLTSSEGYSSHGISSYHPCRDLLRNELSSYGTMLEPALPALPEEINTTVSSKQTTIDALMQQYFTSVEADHPSIVANVVRTADKLRGDGLDLAEQHCELCEMPLRGKAPSLSRICNACIRIMPV